MVNFKNANSMPVNGQIESISGIFVNRSMSRKNEYDSKAKFLANIIDIAIGCFTNNPPEGFEESHIKQFVNTYLDYKNKAINPEPRFHNSKSLKQIMNDVLIYFQESSGKAADAFWKEVYAKKLNVKRVNRFQKILKRGKIKDQNEYDTIIDLYNTYIETKMLSQNDILKINKLISDFEKAGS